MKKTDKLKDPILNSPKSAFFTPWDTPPDAVNDAGVKWWRDDNSTSYAKSVGRMRKFQLPIQVFFAETPEKERTHLIIMNGQIVGESQSMEGVGSQIDKLYIIHQMQKKSMKPKTGRRL